MNFTRKELINTETTMNQMRNSLYGLVRFMKKNGIKETGNIFRRMGEDIARTFIKYWQPTEIVTLSNLKDVITTIYQKVFNSSISIEVDDSENLVIVQDYKCALCKYQYDDVEVAGCEILIGMVSEFVLLINKKSNDSKALFLEPHEVKKSRVYGDKSCIQIYKYK